MEDANMWTVDRLKDASTHELTELFKTLQAPSIQEMDGEYRGYYFGADSHPISDLIWHLGANVNVLSGIWQGKSFTPISDTEGYGINNQKKSGMILRKWPTRTSIGPSRYDGENVFALNYRYYYSTAGKVHMQDEIRKVNDRLYLGVGHWRLPVGIAMASVWFALEGPVGPFDATGGSL
jgi:hypothetical protein